MSRPPNDPWSPIMTPWLQAMRFWSNAAMQWVPPGMGTDWMQQLSQVVPGVYPPTGMAARGTIAVRIASQRPAEVSVHLEPGAETMPLTVDAAASAASPSTPLRDISLSFAAGCLRVAVSIPDDQPPGRYFGLIRDGAGARRGEVQVDVSIGASD